MSEETLQSDFYEHGIKVEDHEDPPANLICLATRRLPIYAGFTTSILDDEGRSMNDLVVSLFDVKGPHWVAHYYEEGDVTYCLRSALYRLDRIVRLYSEKCELFEEWHPDDTSGNTSDPRVYFEVDALLTDIRRVYDAISKVLWKHYMPRNQSGRWRSIKSAVASQGVIPDRFSQELTTSWNDVGAQATEYRDCLMHSVPLTDGAATFWMTRFGGRWGATVRLPATQRAAAERTMTSKTALMRFSTATA